MKKTLIALAALASISAFAAGPTVYGKVDLGLSSSTSNATDNVDQGLVPADSSYESSRFGIKGEADAGAGLKVVYQLESRVNFADGKVGGKLTGTAGEKEQLFNRVAKAGLAGGFGTVLAGLDWTPYDNAWNDALEYNGFSAMGGAWGNGSHSDQGTTGDGNAVAALQYITPDLNGLTATIMYAPGQNKTATGAASSYTGFGLNYATGPLAVNFAYESKKPQGDLLTKDTTTAWILATSYNLGVATVFGGLEQADTGATGKDSGYELGVSVPVGKVTYALGYASESNTVSGSSDGKANSLGLQAVYALTPALALYAGYNTTDNTTATTQTKVTTTKLATGFRYNF